MSSMLYVCFVSLLYRKINETLLARRLRMSICSLDIMYSHAKRHEVISRVVP